jgi:hypothetical protein
MSMRETLPLLALAVQITPSPTAMPVGSPPSGIGSPSAIPVSAFVLVTVSEPKPATHSAPSANVMARGKVSSSTVSRCAPVVASKDWMPPSSVTHSRSSTRMTLAGFVKTSPVAVWAPAAS